MKNLIVHDLFNIAKRLRQIDKKYFVLRNKKLHRFEIHYKGKNSTLQLVLPYKNLDKRTLDLVLKTRVENRQKLFRQMEENNQKLIKNSTKKLVDEASFKLKEMLSYCNKTSASVDFNKTYQNKWE